ncbi:hypothetical protein H5410_023035 [Solanum commersonii]|uniref:Uncharacterized protein n=1 Tax=Solanum commersonii TaxID=4109 RepID=A0A9J5ZGF8_SOLCO|nr:hypothetical protein H5410_023035 [Solanum commersonii]
MYMMFSIFSEMKKGNSEISNFKKKRFSLKYELVNEWSEKPICSTCIEELKEHLKNLHKEFDQLKTKYEKLASFVNYVKTIHDEN